MPRRWYSYGPDVSAWIEANCVLPSGEHIGRPFRLMDWQKEWINELYACDAKHDTATGEPCPHCRVTPK